MSGDQPGKCSMIRQIVRIRQMLRRWRQKAAAASRQSVGVPSDVPAGHIAVTVGRSGRRFVVRATHLNHPIFISLLDQAEEEYGLTSRVGPLLIPCEELLFEEIIRFVGRSGSTSCSRVVNLEDLKRNCHSEADVVSESGPLIARKTVY